MESGMLKPLLSKSFIACIQTNDILYGFCHEWWSLGIFRYWTVWFSDFQSLDWSDVNKNSCTLVNAYSESRLYYNMLNKNSLAVENDYKQLERPWYSYALMYW